MGLPCLSEASLSSRLIDIKHNPHNINSVRHNEFHSVRGSYDEG